MTKLCKAFYNWAPCILAWTLLLSCSGAFFILLSPELIKFIGIYGWAVVGFDVIFFLISVVNFMRAMLMDPGIIPKGLFIFFFYISLFMFNISRLLRRTVK